MLESDDDAAVPGPLPESASRRWQRVEQALDLALETDPEHWPALVDEACGADEDLRRELESLLARYTTARRFLESPPAAAMAALAREAADLGESESIEGRRIGAYRIVRQIGRGGMSRVFLAERADGQFSQQVALKLLHPGLDTGVDRARFLTERQVLASLNHPNIARLLDGGVSDDGQPYLVLEHVKGQPIDRYCVAGRLSVRARLELFRDVIAATQYAHRNLVIHRDLKPSNILVTDEGVVKLLDFGLAKLLGPEANVGQPLTRTGQRWMTPEYAAPEQIRGEPVATLTDVYQLGVVLYEMLTGRLPFPGPHPSLHALEASVLHEEPMLPSAAAGRDGGPALAKTLRGDLDAILTCALQKEPGRRYPSAAALGEDIERHLQRRPVRARPDGAGYRFRRFVRRHAAVVAVGAFAFVTLLAATLFSVRRMNEARQQRDVAIYERRRANVQADFQSLLLSEVGDQPITMRQILDTGRVLLKREYGQDPTFLSTLLTQLADRYGEIGDTKVRGNLLAEAESLAVSGTGGVGLAPIRCDMADNLRMQGRYAEAWRTLDGADSLLGPASASTDRATCLTVRATLANETGHAEQSIAAARQALAIKARLGQTRDMEYLALLNTLATSLDGAGRPRDAVGLFRRVIAVMDSSGRGGTLDRAVVRHDMAVTLVELGEDAEAERLFHDALVRSLRSDPAGPINWQPAIHYAEAALTQAHPDSALKYFSRIVGQAVRDSNLYWEGRGVFGVARADVQLGRLADARRERARLDQIIAVDPQVKRTDDLIPDGHIIGGLLALAQRDTARAGTELMEALQTNGYFDGRSRRRLRPVVTMLAECELGLGHPADAFRLAQQALAIAAVDSLARGRSAGVGEAQLIEARARLAMGDTAAARSALVAAVRALRVGAGPQHPRTKEAEALLRRLGSGLRSDGGRAPE